VSPPPVMPPGEQLLLALNRLGQAARLSAWHNAGPTHLTPLQADILLNLSGGPQPRRQAELVEALASTPPTVSDALRILTAKGLLDRARDPADARAVTLTLTELGRTEAARLATVPGPWRAALDALTPRDVADLLRGVTTMIRVLQEQRAIPVSRTCVTCHFYRPAADPQADGHPHHCRLVDADFADLDLRVDCPEHQPSPPNPA
jgi:DNA-binding MarR family transcriptional regulator